MGNSSDAVVLRQIRIDREQYSYHHEMNHPLFGRCRYFHCNESNQWLSSKLLQFSNRDESSLVLLRLHQSIEHPNSDMLKVKHATPVEEDSSCSSMSSKIMVWFEPSDGTLESRVLECINLCQPFTESFIWNVALHLASALKSLHQRNRFHGHVTPRNMLFSSKKEPRLNDVILSNYFSSEATMETTEGKRKKLLQPMLPVQMRCLRSGATQIQDLNAYSGDIYCLGLVLYEMVTLQSPLLYYSFDENKIDLWQIQDNIRQKNGFYTSRLLNFVNSMLVSTDRDRPTAQQIWQDIVHPTKSASSRKSAQSQATEEIRHLE